MRISLDEVLRVSHEGQALESTPGTTQGAQSVVEALESREIQMTMEAISREPDVREQVVASLREQIESGSYFVSGEQIAQMMVRRALVDRMR
jgi:anti-sigma28 factor (negative regulator of flagellin synthesis)